MSLKIIAGTSKGRILKTLPQWDLSIRPMLCSVKKSVFDIMQFKIYNSSFIDLFAGVGSVGIEALSRGAKKAVFVELSTASLSLIRYNVNMLGFNNRSEIIKCDIINDFHVLSGSKYDIVFIGAPYKDKKGNPFVSTYLVLENIVRYNILKSDSVIIVQKHSKESINDVVNLECFRTKKYGGDTVVFFYRYKCEK
ncbi:MAG: 16S rRNA (guanine(966)-N(2))-methyltransferase RsmD [Endomicrobium sp.]|nr:16S rRNA (guanine(966)-N(2))-methyltransferase RsmD [Endomicrobium sp.]